MCHVSSFGCFLVPFRIARGFVACPIRQQSAGIGPTPCPSRPHSARPRVVGRRLLLFFSLVYLFIRWSHATSAGDGDNKRSTEWMSAALMPTISSDQWCCGAVGGGLAYGETESRTGTTGAAFLRWRGSGFGKHRGNSAQSCICRYICMMSGILLI